MEKLNVINPYTLEVDRSYTYDSESDLKDKVLRLNEAQRRWKALDVERRRDLVQRALSYFEENRVNIAKDITLQMGRPLHQAQNEINGLLERGNHMCSIATDVLAPHSCLPKEDFERHIAHEPLGVIFVISAWNYPLLITVNSVVPSLIAGNTVLLKHSSQTPEIAQHFERAFCHLGEYSDLLLSTVCSHELTGEVIENMAIDHVVFTGSVGGGRKISEHCGRRFFSPALELGGKDGAYVAEDCIIAHAKETVVDGAMYNAGQSCCGIERVYVHERVYEQFVSESKALIESYKLGDPLNRNTSMGPLSTPRAVDVMEAQVKDALEKGAKLLCGGKRAVIEGATFFEPTLLVNVNHTMEIMNEENFGPIMPVMKVSSMEEAVELINDSEYGLTSAIFTTDLRKAESFAANAETGTVFMNRCDYLDPALPWSGVKNSGCGSALSPYGYYGLTRRKSIHFRTVLR
jgi:acyl-CoA reductase-like NAD-dependent aldehyde dehydrogenase